MATRGKAKKANEYRATKKGISMGERMLYKELGRQYRVNSGIQKQWEKNKEAKELGGGTY
jgi:hypothetical protein